MDISTVTTAVIDALREAISSTISYGIKAIVAIIVVLIGVVVAWAAKTVIVRGLSFLQVKKYTDAVGLNKVIDKDIEVVELIGDIVKWVIILTFVVSVLDALNLTGVKDLLDQVLAFVPSVARALLLLFIGVVVADLVSRVVKATANTVGVRVSEILSDIARWAIIIFAFLGAMQQLGLAVSLIDILWTGIVAFFAIAGGLAFGLGGKDAATSMIDRVRKALPKK